MYSEGEEYPDNESNGKDIELLFPEHIISLKIHNNEHWILNFFLFYNPY